MLATGLDGWCEAHQEPCGDKQQEHAEADFQFSLRSLVCKAGTEGPRGRLAAIGVRHLLPGITDNVKAREHARIIPGWRPMVAPVPKQGRKGVGGSSVR
jgi:hypothetical protein